jgi:hypothetical protein
LQFSSATVLAEIQRNPLQNMYLPHLLLKVALKRTGNFSDRIREFLGIEQGI